MTVAPTSAVRHQFHRYHRPMPNRSKRPRPQFQHQPPIYDAIKEKVLEIVAEKTGYPKDMLDLELDLEADLGVDTVKQAEMFASVRAAYNIPREETLKLRDFPTLAHVIQFAIDKQCRVASSAWRSLLSLDTPSAGMKSRLVPARPSCLSLTSMRQIESLAAYRYPICVRPSLICKATGVTLGPGSRVVVMPDKGGVAEKLTNTPAQWASKCWASTVPGFEAVVDLLNKWTAGGPIKESTGCPPSIPRVVSARWICSPGVKRCGCG